MNDLNLHIWPKPRIHLRWFRDGVRWVSPDNTDVAIYFKAIVTITRWWGVAIVYHPRAKREAAGEGKDA